MDHIRNIQEVIDENKETVPTEAVRVVMENTQKLYDIHKDLYNITWTVMDPHAHVEVCDEDEDIAHVKLTHKTQTLIVEAVDNLPPCRHRGRVSDFLLPDRGMVLKNWLEREVPWIRQFGEDSLIIIHSIVPYAPRKHTRDDA